MGPDLSDSLLVNRVHQNYENDPDQGVEGP